MNAPVSLPLLAFSAALLALERVCYVWISREPDQFQLAIRRIWPGQTDASAAVRTLFYLFKVVQASVLLSWVIVHAKGAFWPPSAPMEATVIGIVLIAFGQVLNVCVFRRLGRVGVFYGNLFGHDVPHCRVFPFSWFAHPQYLGTVLSIWGGFAILRYPHADWYVLPLLETAYYAVGASLEQ